MKILFWEFHPFTLAWPSDIGALWRPVEPALFDRARRLFGWAP